MNVTIGGTRRHLQVWVNDIKLDPTSEKFVTIGGTRRQLQSVGYIDLRGVYLPHALARMSYVSNHDLKRLQMVSKEIYTLR